MPRPRSAKNRDLPKRWCWDHKALYYQVPKGQESAWEGKVKFFLGKDLKTAHLKFGDMLRDLKAELSPIGSIRNVGDALDYYLLTESPKKAEASFENDQYCVKRLKPALGHLRLTKVTPRLCYAYITARQAPMQAQKEIRLLSAMLTAAVYWSLIDSNPLIGQMQYKKADDKEQRYVTDDEFIDAALVGNYWLWTYMVLKLATGLRQKDMRNLQVSDIKEDGLHVVISKSRKKTKKLRIFSLPATLRHTLELHLAGRTEGFVFITERGNGFGKSSFESAWGRMMKVYTEAGGIHFTEHDVRGKAGSDEPDVESARRLLVQASTKVTIAHYRRAPERVQSSGQ